jgi:orotidine-5'-phosphate decarboxylase
LVPYIPLLIPAVGAQGGNLEASVKAAQRNFIINSSRGIIFSGDPRAETEKLHKEINLHLNEMGAQ